LPWIYLISHKYDRITFSTGGEYNFAIVGPRYDGKHLPRIEKLYEPVNSTATSYWEDPTFLIADSWSPFDSFYNFSHLVKIISQNIVESLFLFMKFTPLLLLLVLTNSSQIVLKDRKLRIIAFVALIYITGLLMLFIDQRFLIHIRIILIVITGKYFADFLNRFRLNSN
jgi:hypothetical protein